MKNSIENQEMLLDMNRVNKTTVRTIAMGSISLNRKSSRK